ncbi:hypothetical protein CC78DRAFT_586141 [Lojkania enalia]|uniref:CFEM domain-containing protein n=1 Tax=Lojkania enalia TaxID=147567 RepID=A0A9P4K4H7_9PLEO|nr:hypothetical protein CC78DRAFT_586141 [Didymosphaeria enalia]
MTLPSLIAATPQQPSSTSSLPSSPLPAALARALPACAQPCVQAALFNRFPLACTIDPDLHCLCSRYSNSGEALGEVALACLYASCSTVESSAVSVYNICLGQRDAVLPTQTALTVTAASSIMSKLVSSTGSFVTSSKPPTLASISQLQTASSTLTRLTTATSIFADSVPTSVFSSSPMQSATTTTVSTEAPRTMKPAQIAGLSIAAAATFILAIGLMVLSVYLRRRRERKQVSEITPSEKRGSGARDNSGRLSKHFVMNISSPSVSDNESSYSTPKSQKAGTNLTPAPGYFNSNTYTNTYPKPTNLNASVRAAQPRPNPPSRENLSSIHPALRPGAGYSNNSSSLSVPLDQIGLAITAEPPKSTPPTALALPQQPQRAEAKEKRVKNPRPADAYQRPDSVFSQDTVFEEDLLSPRRVSMLLPAPSLPVPPIPVPPIRTMQPRRLQAAPSATAMTHRPYPARQQSLQQPGLSLNIPVRHSRSQPMRVALTENVPVRHAKSQPLRNASTSPSSSRSAVQFPVPLMHSGSPARIRTSSVYDQYKYVSTAASTPEPTLEEDIPDYYFLAHGKLAKYTKTTASPNRIVRPNESPKLVNIKPRFSSGNVSRNTSRDTAYNRDSMSSQTSFETVDPNDPTPEDDDDGKRLSYENQLSPVAESPISNLRYPKVPRASNQLVPRSPVTPRSPHSPSSSSPASQRGERTPHNLPEPSALFVKRRGEHEALALENQLLNMCSSPKKTEIRNHMRNFRQHVRSSSVETAWEPTPPTSQRHTRVQSGQWPKSPAMYDMDVVKPLNFNSKVKAPPAPVDVETLKSPLWVPRLTPTRKGDDLLLSVTYSKGERG